MLQVQHFITNIPALMFLDTPSCKYFFFCLYKCFIAIQKKHFRCTLLCFILQHCVCECVCTNIVGHHDGEQGLVVRIKSDIQGRGLDHDEDSMKD